jgi:hypothetical protein
MLESVGEGRMMMTVRVSVMPRQDAEGRVTQLFIPTNVEAAADFITEGFSFAFVSELAEELAYRCDEADDAEDDTPLTTELLGFTLSDQIADLMRLVPEGASLEPLIDVLGEWVEQLKALQNKRL